MKKTLLLALAAVATIFTSCSSDITNDNDDSNNGQGKGMTLIANVEQDDTRATFEPNDTYGSTWKFTYTDNDQVYVGNNLIGNYYTFTKSGANFSCADAQATQKETNWYAYYPGIDIDLTNQDGKADGSAAKLYALAGATTTATTGAAGLTIDMKAQAAVLRIVKVDNYGPCDIFLKTKEGKYVSGLKAKKDDAGFEVVTSDTKVSVFKVANENTAGIYYVIVPAGVYLEVWNEDRKFKTTSNGLNPGKYYTLTSGPTSGTATATVTINGETKTMTIGWVQLHIGGPRFATENVAEKMTWTEAAKTGDDYVWGKNWRTPSLDDVKSMNNESNWLNTEILDVAYKYKNDKHGFTLISKQPGYKNTANETFISGNQEKSQNEYVETTLWLTDELTAGYGTSLGIIYYGEGYLNVHYNSQDHNYSLHPVRPVLSQETVLWGEQNIK